MIATSPSAKSSVPILGAGAAERPATRLVRSITGNDYISWSQINGYRTCPQKYRFSYIDKARPDFIPTALHFGGAVHSAIELHFQARMEGRHVSERDLFELFTVRWSERKEGHEDIPLKFNKREDQKSLFDLARRMLAAFLASPLAEAQGQLLAIEEQLRLTLDPSLPDVLCRVDLIWQDPTAVHLVDFKTSKSRWSPAKAEEAAEQLLLYRHMAKGMARDLQLPMILSFIVLTKHVTPQVDEFAIQADAVRLQQIGQTFRAAWASIASGTFYPSPSAQNCTTCPFRSQCPAFSGR